MNSERRVYTPSFHADDMASEEPGGARRKWMIGAIMAIVVAAVGAVAWNVYGSSGPPPLIEAPSGDYKTLASPAPSSDVDDHELDDAIARAKANVQGDETRGPAAPSLSLAPSSPQPRGTYLVQLGALRSRDAAEDAWRAFSIRAPDLIHGAHSEIQRAELGAQGVFFRLRVGYFDTNGRAGAYCAKAKAAGQDCMVVAQ